MISILLIWTSVTGEPKINPIIVDNMEVCHQMADVINDSKNPDLEAACVTSYQSLGGNKSDSDHRNE